jgi:tripartite-type tricarboxylate transporter receptor subunit TctC
MNIVRRTVLALVAFGTLIAGGIAQAQNFPIKPLRLIVPYPAGGLTDVVARLMAQRAGTLLGQPMVVENRPGASTIIGAELVAKSAPDGHMLLMATSTTLATNPIVFKNLSYKTSDFAPVALAGKVPQILAAHPSVPANSLRELVAYSKANPGKVTFGTPGQGSSSHLLGELFKYLTGADIRDIPYKGSVPMLSALLAGEVGLCFDGMPNYVPHIQAGRLKAVGLFGDSRVQSIPDVPTFPELGYKEAAIYYWFGVVVPAATPRAVVARLNAVFNESLATQEVKDKVRAALAYVEPSTPEAFGAMIRHEADLWEKVAKPLKIQLD